MGPGTSRWQPMASQPPRLHQTPLAPSIQFLRYRYGQGTAIKLRHLPSHRPPQLFCQPILATGLARLAALTQRCRQ